MEISLRNLRRVQIVVFRLAVVITTCGLLTAIVAEALPSAGKYSAEALRENTLGVAYMNQQKPADAQKYFERALVADPNFAEARLNLGISLLGQQKLEAGRAALQEAASKLPNDPYAWYNLGLACKDLSDPESGIAAFRELFVRVKRRATAFKPFHSGFL